MSCQPSRPAQSRYSSVLHFVLCSERTITTTNVAGGGSVDSYVITDDSFPAGLTIEDLQIYIDVSALYNLKFNLRVEGAVRPNVFVVGASLLTGITTGGYHPAYTNNRGDLAVQCRIVLEVAVAVPITAPTGIATFTISAAPRLFT